MSPAVFTDQCNPDTSDHKVIKYVYLWIIIVVVFISVTLILVIIM